MNNSNTQQSLDPRHDPTASIRRKRLFMMVSLMALVILFIAGFIIWQEFSTKFIAPPKETMIQVNERSFSRGDLVKLVRAQFKEAELYGTPFNMGSDVFLALQELRDNEMLRVLSPELEISVTEAEIDEKIWLTFAPDDDSSKGKTDAQVRREFNEELGKYLNWVQLNEEEHRWIVESDLLRLKAMESISHLVKNPVEQVRLHRIVMSAGDETDIMQSKLRGAIGDSRDPEHIRLVLSGIVREFSRDTDFSVRRNGGDLGWIPANIMVEHEGYFWDLAPGALSERAGFLDPTRQEEFIYFVISERNQSRELDPGDFEILKEIALTNWINDKTQEHQLKSEFNSEIYSWVIDQIRLAASPSNNQNVSSSDIPLPIPTN
ncbi:MAG: hypothetical protein ACJ0A3_00530 [Dehalococcoidia bacterium]